MYRAIPSASKILTNKWQSNEHDIHMQNLRKIKGTVDMKEPPKFKHLKKKMKKTQMLEGKLSKEGSYSVTTNKNGENKSY